MDRAGRELQEGRSLSDAAAVVAAPRRRGSYCRCCCLEHCPPHSRCCCAVAAAEGGEGAAPWALWVRSASWAPVALADGEQLVLAAAVPAPSQAAQAQRQHGMQPLLQKAALTPHSAAAAEEAAAEPRRPGPRAWCSYACSCDHPRLPVHPGCLHAQEQL